MPGTAATANLHSAVLAPATGIYFVAHYNPAHALPHEVLISAGTPLPKCRICVGVRFSFESLRTAAF
jgi:hypothetical protein